ncbi:hypothetical protein [Engelhardtia mirabilis]|uniref:hypothetical protein n=1 Tax=Engelhardtia mirabilis TaxID=2528011 RepID=UPI0011A8D74A
MSEGRDGATEALEHRVASTEVLRGNGEILLGKPAGELGCIEIVDGLARPPADLAIDAPVLVVGIRIEGVDCSYLELDGT